MITSRTLDDHDHVLDVMLNHRIANGLYDGLEAVLVVLDRGRLE